MLKKEDKDGTIEFLKDTLENIHELTKVNDTYLLPMTLDEIKDICEKSLFEVTF